MGRIRFLANIEPERVATPTYRIPGVSGSSGATMDFIRPEMNSKGKLQRDGQATHFLQHVLRQYISTPIPELAYAHQNRRFALVSALFRSVSQVRKVNRQELYRYSEQGISTAARINAGR